MSNITQKNFSDSLSTLKDKVCVRSPIGRVKIFEKTNNELNPLIDSSNLVVYQGRELLLQRAFGQNIAGYPSTTPNSYIKWLGLGSGGTGSNLFIPIVPDVLDTDLIQPIIINSQDAICINGGKLHPFDSVDFESDYQNGNKKLIAKITTTISALDANGPDGGDDEGDYYDINEAGLYVSDTTDSISSIKLFARVTFSTIRKNSSRVLVFVWYIFF